MDELVSLLSSGVHNVIVMVGAGISVASGIPDFRSPDTGLYASIQSVAALARQRPTFVFELDVFQSDPRPFWWIFSKMWPATAGATPTPFHFLLNLLHEKQILLRCYTQNVDGLENLAGLPKEKIVYAHGVLNTCHCLTCGQCFPISLCMDAMERNLANTESTIENAVVPQCPACGSLFVKPDVVFFSEDLPDAFYEQFPVDFEQADCLIIAGTSLEVYPFASLPEKVARGVKRFLVNNVMVKCKHKFHFNGERDWFMQGDVQEFAGTLCQRMGWGEEHRRMIEGRKTLNDSWKPEVTVKEEPQ